jgi:2-polyprenyl-3-methyl-5-hydroxy-6-metoxy-1,4-benzoquinol methylase
MGFSPRDGILECEPALPPIEWEEVPCPLCDSLEWSHKVEARVPAPVRESRWFLVVKCRGCGLCFTNPRPTARCLLRLYPPDLPPLLAPPVAPRRWWRLHGRSDRPAWLWPTLERAEILDLGCGVGSFQRRLRRRGVPFTAVNLSVPAAEFLRREWGVPALAGTLPHPDLAGRTFTAVTLFDALEHAHEPLDLLRAAHELLAPGGVLVARVPNLEGLPFRWLGADWFGLDLPRHLTHFTPRTLQLMLHRAGFRVQCVIGQGQGSWLRASARLACRRPDASSWHRLLRHKPVASLAAWYSSLVRRANAMLAVAVPEGS